MEMVLIKKISEEVRDKIEQEKPVVIYCKRGIRSQIAIQRLQRKLPNVEFYNLDGGIYNL